MKLVIFGASGGTGRCLVEQALEAGYQVTAFVRNPSASPRSYGNLKVVKGDVLDAAAVDAAIADQDAVLVALGVGRSGGTVLSQGTLNIVNAMRKHEVKRLVVESSYGVAESFGEASFTCRFLLNRLLKATYADKAKQEEIIRRSGLEWVIVRPPRLTNGFGTRNYRIGEHVRLGVRHSVSRSDVANFMLQMTRDSAWLSKAPTMWYEARPGY